MKALQSSAGTVVSLSAKVTDAVHKHFGASYGPWDEIEIRKVTDNPAWVTVALKPNDRYVIDKENKVEYILPAKVKGLVATLRGNLPYEAGLRISSNGTDHVLWSYKRSIHIPTVMWRTFADGTAEEYRRLTEL